MSSSSSRPPRKIAGGTNSPGFGLQSVVIVVAPDQACAETVAAGFATQGEPMRVLWFEQTRQALDAGPQNALVGVVLCHRAERIPESELEALRRALPDTPVLPWALPHAA